MLDYLIKILTAVPFLDLLFILVARVVEVSIGTLRVILMNKGFRLISSILAFIEVLIWVIVASSVLTEVAKEPIKVIVYSFGFALGVYLGSIIESKVALGNILIQVIVPDIKGLEIAAMIRNEGVAVTTVHAEGKDSGKIVLMIYSKRRGKDKIIAKIIELEKNALIVCNDISSLQGGYLNPSRRFTK